MKRYIALVLVLVLVLVLALSLPLISQAESKYEGYTFEQLQTEYLAILEAMWKTKEWQKVEVPAGVYQVGVEIPAGEWTISSDESLAIYVGTKLDATKTKVEWDNITAGEFVDIKDFKNGWTVVLTIGDFIEFDEIVYFTVPVKGQGFTFK